MFTAVGGTHNGGPGGGIWTKLVGSIQLELEQDVLRIAWGKMGILPTLGWGPVVAVCTVTVAVLVTAGDDFVRFTKV